MTVFRLPDLGEGLSDAEIVTWHVSEGDHAVAGQPLVSVETDKAVVEIPAPYAGTIVRLIKAEGDIVKVGGALIDIDTGKASDAGAIVGQLDDLAKPTPAAIPRPVGRDTSKATPAARRLAKAKGIALSDITATGPGGTIVTRDIEVAGATTSGEELRGARRTMARAMTKSHAVVVPATVTDTVDISSWPDTEKPTLRLIHAIVSACLVEPALNAWFDGRLRQLHDQIDLALAMDTADGLFTPVLHGVQSSPDLQAQLEQAKRAVRDRTISPVDMQRATISLSNFGSIGGVFAALVVTPPQVAILGAGRIFQQCGVADGGLVVRRVLPLSLTFDHRVVTGGEAARFLAALREDLERPGETGQVER